MDRVEGEAGRLKIAIVGAGIAGLSCAWLLAPRHDVTVYEAADRAGGHAHTVEIGGRPVDTGFIVYNEPTYPNLTALFAVLGVETEPSCMSFAASLDNGRLEYAGTGLAGLFAQKRNLLRPRFWSMLRDLARLYREAPNDAVMAEPDLTSLGDWLDARGYGAAVQQDHLLPMAAAIWSCGAGAVRDFPAAAFFRFCDNHGLLRLSNRPDWRTVRGGSREYVAKLTAGFADRIRLDRPVASVSREAGGAVLRDTAGEVRHFDQVVIATHAPQALAMLEDADAEETALLGAFRTSRNLAVLHTDSRFMPRRRAVWSSWNFLGRAEGPPCVTYWMNRLQNFAEPANMFVTLNPGRPPAAGSILHSQIYRHPIFDVAAMQAQRRFWPMQGRRGTWFCGAYLGAGFHEDGVQAGLAVAEALGGVRRPWRVANESGRIHLGAPAGAVAVPG